MKKCFWMCCLTACALANQNSLPEQGTMSKVSGTLSLQEPDPTRISSGKSAVLPSHPMLAAQSGKQDSTRWKEYIYAKDNFAVSAPAAPEVDHSNVWVEYSINLKDGSVHVAVVPPGQFTPESVYASESFFIATLNTKEDAESSERDDVTMTGCPNGFKFEYKTQSLHGHVHACVIKHKLLMISSRASLDAPLPADADRIFASFRLIK